MPRRLNWTLSAALLALTSPACSKDSPTPAAPPSAAASRETDAVPVVDLRPASQPAPAPRSEWKRQFDTHWRAAQSEDENGNWARALEHYQQLTALVPHEPVMQFNIARMKARLGATDEVFGALAAAVRFGWCDAENLAKETSFAGLVMDERFVKLIEEARAAADERFCIYRPAALAADTPAPLIVALHARGENARAHLPGWTAAADRLGAIVVAVRGTGAGLTKVVFTWDDPAAQQARDPMQIDTPAIGAAVDAAIKAVEEKHRIDPARIVLAGYSQGALAAIELYAAQPKRYAGLYLASPLYRPDATVDWTKLAAERKAPVYVLSGKLNRMHAAADELAGSLTAAGYDVRFDALDDVGHEPPPDNTDRQVAGIQHLLK